MAKDYYPDVQKYVAEPGMVYPEHIGKWHIRLIYESILEFPLLSD